MNRLVEVRAYKLKPGAREAFHAAVKLTSVPMLLRWGTDVVAFGPSVAEADDYFLIRAYADIHDLNERQGAFYSSSEWRGGPRESIVSLIESSLNAHIWLSPVSIDDLRSSNVMASR
jgi:hypothetical protein